jgi:hypothetical protein
MGTVFTTCKIHGEFSAALTSSVWSILDSNASEKGEE